MGFGRVAALGVIVEVASARLSELVESTVAVDG